MDSKLSPFLPGTHIQFAWDSTSLGWLKECPRKYYYSMIEGWRKKGGSLHLDFGGWYHSGLELYDRLRAEGRSHDESQDEMVGKAMEWTWVRHVCEVCDGSGFATPGSGHGDVCPNCGGQKETTPSKAWSTDDPNKTRETLIRSLIWYTDHFKDDPAQTVILTNGKPAVELSFKLELDRGPAEGNDVTATNIDMRRRGEAVPSVGQPYVLCGHMDRVVNYIDGTYIMDRKTTKTTVSSTYFDQYSPDNQMSLYAFAGRIIYNLPIKGVIIDAAQIAVGFTRFSRGFTHRTETQLNEWLDDSYRWFATAETYARAGFWPMNDKSCHNYGGCPFRRVCNKDSSVRVKFLESDFYKKEWNPLVPR